MAGGQFNNCLKELLQNVGDDTVSDLINSSRSAELVRNMIEKSQHLRKRDDYSLLKAFILFLDYSGLKCYIGYTSARDMSLLKYLWNNSKPKSAEWEKKV